MSQKIQGIALDFYVEVSDDSQSLVEGRELADGVAT